MKERHAPGGCWTELRGTPDMPNDAKLGLVVGVALVIAVAVVFFRKDGPARLVKAELNPAAATAPAETTPAPPRNEVPAATAPGKQHVIQPGETLSSIARQHYGDGDELFRIYKANRQLLENPDRLPVGQTLTIP